MGKVQFSEGLSPCLYYCLRHIQHCGFSLNDQLHNRIFEQLMMILCETGVKTNAVPKTDVKVNDVPKYEVLTI